MAHMEEVLDLYEEPYDPRRPVVCFDETSTQLLAEPRPALPTQPGLPLRRGLRVSARGHTEPVLGLRAAGRVAARGGDPTAHEGGLCPTDAMAGGRGLSGGRGDPGSSWTT